MQLTDYFSIRPKSAQYVADGFMVRRIVSAAAFTVMELLVVIAVIAILAALLIAGTALVRAGTERTACASNLRNIGTAIHAFVSDHDGNLPPGARVSGFPGNFHRALEPYLGEMLEQHISQDVFYCPTNVRLGSPPPRGFNTPGPNYKGWSGYFMGYLFNASLFRITNGNINNPSYVPESESRIRYHSVLHPSNTVALMDMRTRAPGVGGPPTSGLARGTYFDPNHAQWSLGLVHNGHGNMLFLDGHIESFDGSERLSVRSLPQQEEPWW